MPKYIVGIDEAGRAAHKRRASLAQNFIVGIDEAGRGPLAGPVTVAAVAIPEFGIRNKELWFKDIKDSKKLSLKKREEWFRDFKNNPRLQHSVSSISHSVIDKKGISYALRLGVRRCLTKLNSYFQIRNSLVLLDGSLYAPPEYNQKTIIRGDEKIPIISAASIIAKVTRDRKMVQAAKKYPKYAFEIHKGYGTFLHRKLIKKRGLSKIHRKSFCTKLV